MNSIPTINNILDDHDFQKNNYVCTTEKSKSLNFLKEKEASVPVEDMIIRSVAANIFDTSNSIAYRGKLLIIGCIVD
jgi:hypothetical protein